MWQLAVRAGVIHRERKLMGEQLGDLIDRNIVLRGQLLDGLVTQNLTHLIGGDRQVLAGPNPGLHLIAESGLLKLGDDRVQTALAAGPQVVVQDDQRRGRAFFRSSNARPRGPPLTA